MFTSPCSALATLISFLKEAAVDVDSHLQLVTKLQMLDKGRCQVDWRLRGSIAIFPIDVDFASEFGLDLITGRVNSHYEKWDTSRFDNLHPKHMGC